MLVVSHFRELNHYNQELQPSAPFVILNEVKDLAKYKKILRLRLIMTNFCE